MSVFRGPSHRAQTVQVRFVILTEAPVYVDMTRGFYSKQDPLSAAVPSLYLSPQNADPTTLAGLVFLRNSTTFT